MDLDWYCTDMLKVRHLCRCGFLWSFRSLKRQRSPRQHVQFLTFNIQANRVTFVSSIITKIFNPSKCCMVTIQLVLNDTLFISACIVYCQIYIVWLLFFQCFHLIQCFICCSAFVWFDSFVQCSNYSVYVLSWSWKCIPGISIWININPQAINKHHTADSAIFCLSTGARGLLRS